MSKQNIEQCLSQFAGGETQILRFCLEGGETELALLEEKIEFSEICTSINICNPTSTMPPNVYALCL